MKRLLLGLIFLNLWTASWSGLLAQVEYEEVFPLLYGQDLRDTVLMSYKPATVLSYGNARDSLFRHVFGKNDSLSCVYSGHRVYMDPAEDPTTTVYQNGGSDGINTEHAWPQAYGASVGDARSNMYHLFPTRIKVNEARSNYPFAEIPDAETQAWYYLNQTQSSIPSSNIDLYSEYKEGSFEPREDFKGDIARAMLYFYTIYPIESEMAPDGFFLDQLPTFYQWHRQDPVDSVEWERNSQIAIYQDYKSNPFILDSSLVARAFCQELNLLCSPSGTGDILTPDFFTLSPNPFTEQVTFHYLLPRSGQVRLTLINTLGQEVATLFDGWQAAGMQNIAWHVPLQFQKAGALYFCHLHWQNQGQTMIGVRKMMQKY